MKKIIQGKVVKPLSTVLIAGAVAMFGSTLYCTGKMINDSVEFEKIEKDFNKSDILNESKIEDKLNYYSQYKRGEISASEFDLRCAYLDSDEYKNYVYKNYDSSKFEQMKNLENSKKACGLGALVSLVSTSIFGYAGYNEINRDTKEQNHNNKEKERYW